MSVRQQIFKHKYITQPVVTPANTIIKAHEDKKTALMGKSNNFGQAALDRLQKVQVTFKLESTDYQVRFSKHTLPRVDYDQDLCIPITLSKVLTLQHDINNKKIVALSKVLVVMSISPQMTLVQEQSLVVAS